jgi:hypothetical protein
MPNQDKTLYLHFLEELTYWFYEELTYWFHVVLWRQDVGRFFAVSESMKIKCHLSFISSTSANGLLQYLIMFAWPK